MRIENSFTLALPVEDAWPLLLDAERVAPCLPGAELREVTGEECRGVLKVKLGAITALYTGVLRLVEIDEAARRLVLQAEGQETQGQGGASATVAVTLRPAGEGRTGVSVETDLSITGNIAQFGLNVLTDVSTKLLTDFARCVEHDLLSPGSTATGTATADPGPPATISEIVADEVADMAVDDPERAAQFMSAVTPAPPGAASSPGHGAIRSRPAEPLDLPAVAGPTVAQKAFPAAIVTVFLLQAVVKGRTRRLGLAVVGSALVAAFVAGRQQKG